MKKRILSMMLVLCMVLGMMPVSAFAAEADNLCDHHTEHTADCGYVAAVEGSPCNHAHDETCGYIEAVEGVSCACVAAEDGTLTHAEGCGYVEAVEGSPCTHVHDEVCGYAEAAEERPCTYECADCAAVSEEPSDTPVEPAESYTLTIEQGEGGTITADQYSWTEPTEITFTLTPEEGYTFVSAEVYGGTDQIAWLTPESFTDGTCIFGVPGSDVTVQNIVFEQNTTEPGGEEDTTPAEVTGVSVTVDGVTYTEGDVTITPTSTITLTVTGTSLLNGNFDNTVDYANGLYLYVNPDYFEISEDGTTATYAPSAGDFANSSNFEITYCNNYTDTANRTVVPTGIYLTYDDGIAEEDKAEITGMSITIDGVVYDSSNTSAEDPAVITPNTGFITITVHGTALQNCTADHKVSYYPGAAEPILPDFLWRFEADGTSAFHHYSSASALSDFARNTTPFELQYSNNGSFSAANPAIGSGVYIVYDDSTGGGEDTTPAEVTGVSVTVDGVEYTSGDVTITPTSTIIFTVTGTNFANLSEANSLYYAVGYSKYIVSGWWTVDTAANTATFDNSNRIFEFEECNRFEVQYSNDGNQSWTGTGIYLTYDNGIAEEDKARITGVSVTVDGVEYTSGDVTITPTSTVVFTVTGTNFANLSADNRLWYASGAADHLKSGLWTIDTAANTATFDRSDCISLFERCDQFEVQYSNDAEQSWTGTGIYLTYDDGTGGEEDTTPAEITGVSITVDGETYTSGNVTITPTSTITLTVTGTNLQNGTGDNKVDYAYGAGDPVGPDYFEISEDGSTATSTPPAGRFANSSNFEIKYYNNYTDIENRTEISTGIYLTYEKTIPDSAGKIVVDMADSYGDGWNGAAIEIYKNGSLETTVTVDEISNTVFLDYDSTATYEFKWVKGGYDYECSFTIYVDGEKELSVDDASSYAVGETILTLDDTTGGEEDTTHAEITGVSITVDGETYTEGNVTITPDSTVTLTVTGTNLQNGTDDNKVDYANGAGDPVGPDYFEISEDGSTATSTPPAGRFANSSNFEIKYYNNYTDTANRTVVPTGIYLTYDDGIAEEDRAEITGVSITVDGETYTEGNVTITPDTRSIVYTVTGTNFANLSEANCLRFGISNLVDSLNSELWTIDTETNTATADLSAYIAWFEFCDNSEIEYSNDGFETSIGTGIYLTYDDGIAEEDRAQITGASITVDGVTYTEGNITITPDTQSIVYTLTGKNFGNIGNDQGFSPNGRDAYYVTAMFEISDDTTAVWDATEHMDLFADCNGHQVQYSNDGGNTWVGTGIYLTYDDSTGDDIPIEPADPIVITQQPTDASAKLGENYCVEVIAQGEGLRYQWYFKNAGSEQWHKSGVTDNTYDDVMTTARAGREVYCVITDSHGNSVTTDTASLIALKSVDLAVTKQPESVTANYGERFTVTAEAVGDGVTYEWYYLDPDGESWLSTNVRSATYSATMSKKIDGRAVYCVARDIWGNQVATDAVLLSCERAELVITKQPNDASAKLDEMFCVEVLAEGDGLKYQWYWRQIGAENWNVSGQRDNTYDDVMTSARHNREVYCVITDAWGDSVTTEIATITGTPTTTLAITRQPESQAVMIGDMFNVTFDAQGDGLKYQWYFRPAGTEVWYTSGQRDNSYDDVMTKARHNRELYCVVTDAWGNTVETDPIVVILATPRYELAITAQPENESVKLDEMFCVTVEAQGDELKYQWYWRQVGSETWNVSGQRDNTYDDVMTGARHNREVKCVITDMWGESVETEIATITAIPDQVLAILAQPTDASAAMGENYCVTVEAQGDGLRYQWYFKNAGSDVWHTSGVKDNTYDDVMIESRAGRQVYCVITDIWGNTVTTEIATLICT